MDKIVANDGKGLVNLLGLDEGTLEHQGNYCFMAAKDDSIVDIYTEPTDESNDYIRVNAVYIDGEEYDYVRMVWRTDADKRDENGNETRLLMRHLPKCDSKPRRETDIRRLTRERTRVRSRFLCRQG